MKLHEDGAENVIGNKNCYHFNAICCHSIKRMGIGIILSILALITK